jgi:hypothetical protein
MKSNKMKAVTKIICYLLVREGFLNRNKKCLRFVLAGSLITYSQFSGSIGHIRKRNNDICRRNSNYFLYVYLDSSKLQIKCPKFDKFNKFNQVRELYGIIQKHFICLRYT